MQSKILVCGAICACILLTTCGGGRHRVAPSIQPATDISLDDALVELDAYPCPEGVDEELFEELKDALGEALTERASSVGAIHELPSGEKAGRGDPALQVGSRIVSTPPTGEANRVTDLAILDNSDGTFTLSWHYKNLGDYDQDGVVGLEDIIPLAEHFGEDAAPENEWIDGDLDGRVHISDITPIAMHFAAEVHHYAIEGAADEAGSYELVSEISQDRGTGDGRLEYSAIIESPAALWHRIVPVDSEGTPGEPSNAVLRPSNEPIIYEVSPTEGYQHEECTFTATVSGVEPLTYAWDFGGGATPDTSSESSLTVTLNDAGEYAASLTVTNADGSATLPFSLTVNERDIWAHTWGGGGNEGINDMTIDKEDCIYITGQTGSFGTINNDVLFLKYSPEGEVLWARTWGGEGSESIYGISATNDGRIIAIGSTNSFGQGNTDLLILSHTTGGELQWAKTWGTAEGYERANGEMGLDGEGNIYVCGSYVVWGGEADSMLVKFSPEGDALWAKTWGGGRTTAAAMCS